MLLWVTTMAVLSSWCSLHTSTSAHDTTIDLIDPRVHRLLVQPHQVLKSYMHTCMRAKTSDFLKVLTRTSRCREERNKNNHKGDSFILLTLGNRKRKQLATEAWSTCYWLTAASNVTPLQVLKAFSFFVPFCIWLENHLQKWAILAVLQSTQEFILKIALINLIPFLCLPSPFPSTLLPSCFILQYVTGDELQDNTILTCFLLSFGVQNACI